jgi:hypothetical protein
MPANGDSLDEGDADVVDDSMASHQQCVALTGGTINTGDPASLYQWMAFGGNPPISYDVSVMQMVADDAEAMVYDMMGVAADDDGWRNGAHGFDLKTDDEGIESVRGTANLPAGDYSWILNARDAHQSVMRSWDLRVTETVFVDASGATDTEEVQRSGNDLTMGDWADFISSTTVGTDFGEPTHANGTSPDGTVQALPLGTSPGTDASTTGVINKTASDGESDVDVLWIGGLTPDSVLNVKIKPETELPTGVFNRVSIKLYPFVSGKEKQAAVEPGASKVTGFKDAYSGLDCGHYYLEVSGVDGEEGNYEVTWNFSQ